MKHFAFRMPVKKYVQKYLTALYGPTIPATLDTDIGFVILNTLSSRLDGQVCRGYNKPLQQGKMGQITFIISFHYYYYTKKEVSVHTAILLNRYFENRFEEELIRYMQVQDINCKGGYKKALEAFAALYNIELDEDISFDGLKKMEYRSRKKKFKLSLCNLSPAKTLFSESAA
jgi:hypothetical protein